MENKLILHIGTPKTGTSAIQSFLYENQSLLEQQGFLYPWIQKELYPTINGSSLDYYVKGEIVDTLNEGWIDFWIKTRNILQKKHVILSWEGIFTYNIINFFTAVKKEYDNIQVIVYLRRQDRYIESTWNQLVKINRYTLTFNDYVSSVLLSANYKERLDTIARVIGKENLIVRVYEKGQFQGPRKDAISDFLYALNINIDWNRCVMSRYNNPALFGNYIEIKRRMNFYLPSYPQSSEIESILSENLSYRKKISGIRHADGMFIPQERQAFLKQFEQENAEIARQYLGRKDGILFYDHQPVPMYELDDSTLCDDIKGVFDVLFEKWKKYMMVRCVDSSSLSHSFECVDFKQSELSKELDEIRAKILPKAEFESQCFELVEKYTPFLVKLYNEKSEIYQTIPKYFQELSAGKKLFFFGSGGYCQYLIIETELFPDAFLDNNSKKSNQNFFGKKILHPSQIKDWSNCFVIITVKKPDVIAAMEQQLQGYGLKKGEDYLVGPEYFMDPF